MLCHKGWSPLCPFYGTGYPVKKQVENGLSKLLDLQGHTIYVSDQAIFILRDSGIHDEEGKKTNVSDPLIEAQRRSDSFLSFTMTVHPEKADLNWNYSRMTCRGLNSTPIGCRWDRCQHCY